MGLLHPFHKVEMDLVLHDPSVGRNNLIIVLYLFSLISEDPSLGLSSGINDDRSHLEDGVGMEIILGIGDGEVGVDASGHRFKDGGVAGHLHV